MTDYDLGPDSEWQVSGAGPWPEFTLLLMLAQHWGLFGADCGVRRRVRLVNWAFENDEPIGDPGVILFEDDSPGVRLDSCTFESCTPLPLVDCLIELVAEAWEAHDDT